MIYYLFIVAALGLAPLAVSRGCSGCSAQAPCGSGFSCFGARALGEQGSVVAAHRLSSCDWWTPECGLHNWSGVAWGMWNLPRSGMEPVSPALSAGFLCTMPPGKSLHACMLSRFSRVQLCATLWTQPPRLCRPQDSLGKNSGVGCHFLLWESPYILFIEKIFKIFVCVLYLQHLSIQTNHIWNTSLAPSVSG